MRAIKQKITIALCAMALGSLNVAQATTYELGTLNPTPVTGNVMLAPGSFDDVFNFSVISPNMLLAGAVMNTPMTFGSTKLFDIDSLSAVLFAGLGASGTPLGNLSGNYISQSGVLPVGDYSVRITGIATGSVGGSYTYAAFVQSVPEPEGYAMFFAGLGLIGWITYRRKSI